MLLTLSGLRLELESSSAPVVEVWRELFGDWTPGRHAPDPALQPLQLTLELVRELPGLPAGPPDHVFPYGAGSQGGALEIFRQPDAHLLAFRDAAIVEIPHSSRAGGQPFDFARGWLTPSALVPAFLEDITLTACSPLLRRQGRIMIHAAGAAHRGQAVIFTGPSGCGKTTAALALVASGWSLLGSDVVLLARREETILAWPSPGQTRVRGQGKALLQSAAEGSSGNRVPPFATHLRRGSGDLALLAIRPEVWARPSPVRAVVRPQVEALSRSTMRSEPAALSLAWSMEESADAWDSDMLGAHLDVLHALSRQAAAFTLRFAPDLGELAGLVENSVAAQSGETPTFGGRR